MEAKHTLGPWRIGDAGQTVFGPKSNQPAPVTIATLPAELIAQANARADASKAEAARLRARMADLIYRLSEPIL